MDAPLTTALLLKALFSLIQIAIVHLPKNNWKYFCKKK
jgi:hypothetical protein